MVHRPGLEHRRLTPSNAEDLLFDDVIWVDRAEQEHDAFVELMRDGVDRHRCWIPKLIAGTAARASPRGF
jgi:arginine deiminase